MPAKKPTDDSRNLQNFVRELAAHQSRIRAFLVSVMPGNPDVGDVLQETNIVLWKSRERFQPGTNFLAWAITIARLEVLHYRRRVGRHQKLMISAELMELMADESSHAYDHEAFLQALEGCKSKLPRNQRELLDIRYQPGFTIEKCAHESGKNAATLRTILRRVRLALKECIEQTMKEHFA